MTPEPSLERASRRGRQRERHEAEGGDIAPRVATSLDTSGPARDLRFNYYSHMCDCGGLKIHTCWVS